MTLITGTVQALGYEPLSGKLTARPARFRADGGVVFAPDRKEYNVTAGQVSVELAPGPAKLALKVGSHAYDEWDVVIPDQESITLADLLDTVFPWEPEQVSKFVAERLAAEQAKDDAQAAKGEAEQARTDTQLLAQQASQDRTLVQQIRDLLEEAYNDSAAGFALPPRLTESALSATYLLKDELPEGVVTAADLVGYATRDEIITETDAAALFATQSQLAQVATGDPVEVTDATVAAVVLSGESTQGALAAKYGALSVVELDSDKAVTIPPGRVATVVLRQTNGGGHVAHWPGNVVWDAGVAPRFQTAENAIDVVTFLRTGPTTLGMLSGQFSTPVVGPVMVSPSHTDTTILIDWAEVAGALGYEARVVGRTPVSLQPTARFHQFGGLSPNTAYTVEVRAILPVGHTGWSTLSVTTKAALSLYLSDDFTGTTGAPVHGRVTPTGSVTLSSPGTNVTGVGGAATLYNNNLFASAATGSKQVSWPIGQRNVRVAVDYTLVNAGVGAVTLGVGNGSTNGVSIRALVSSDVRFIFTGVSSETVGSGIPLNGEFAIQVEGKYVTALVNGLPFRTRIMDGYATASFAGVGLTAGDVTVDNLRVWPL